MIQRLLPSMVLAAAVAAAVAAAAPPVQPGSVPAAPGAGERPRTDKDIKQGSLFSAVCFGDSTLGAEWSRLRPEAQARYPDLRLTMVKDLHITVVYIGGDWKPEDLNRIRPLALVVPAAPVRLTPEVVQMGRNNQVVVVELHPASTVWSDAVVAAKDSLNRLGLKKPESYDANFRTHITLAQAAHNPPTAADSSALAEFRSWIAAQVAASPQKFTVTVGPTTRVQLLLAGTARPEGAPEYITVEEFLAPRSTPPAGR